MNLFLKSLMTVSLICLCVGCSTLPQEEEELVPPIIVPKEASYQTKPVSRGDIENAIKVVGEVVPQDIDYVYVTEKNNRIKAIHTSLGSNVNKGDVLLELLTEDILKQIRLEDINISTMTSEMETYKSTYGIEKSMNESRLSLMELDYDRKQLEQQMQINELNFQNSVKTKENQLQIAQIKVSELRTTLKESQIKATLDGTVVFIKKMEEGDFIEAYDKLIGIADENRFQIEYEGTEAAKFQVGSQVVVTFKGATYEAIVTMTPDTVPEEDKEIYKGMAFFSLIDPSVVLGRGSDVEIKYIKEQSQNTLLIPRSLVLMSGENKIVYVLENGIKTEKLVETGVEAGIYIEILEGLNEGDLVIIN
jgi:multidrug efflux pump subunit AcrA (membrane-fusion protein)